MSVMQNLAVWAMALALAVAVAGCGEDKSTNDGLPPAESWQAPPPVAAMGGQDPNATNPHAGLDMNNPHAGLDMNNPHAGLDMNNPHAGLDLPPGFQSPDPARQVDPSKFLKGVIVASAKTRALIKPGDVLFLSARPVDPTSGDVIGAPVAVARVVIDKLPAPFELSGESAMIAGTVFDGPVVIEARVDHDQEARTAEPGDIEGTLRATIPAKNLRLALDTVVK
ncbi:MAG TPA: hypothetical protein VFG83_03245 [Kofleriaceae bacterium]|nr:hypothetical protein [Kofleriaceae bacterium]